MLRGLLTGYVGASCPFRKKELTNKAINLLTNLFVYIVYSACMLFPWQGRVASIQYLVWVFGDICAALLNRP